MEGTRTSSQRVFLLLGSLGPLGHAPASGTMTVAVAGIPIFWALTQLSPTTSAILIFAFTVAAVFMHQVGDRILAEKDSQTLVWDELVGFMIATWSLPFTWPIVVTAFLLERAIDITKVPPANWIERRWPGGLGVVGDDVVAGAYTLLILRSLMAFAPGIWAAPS